MHSRNRILTSFAFLAMALAHDHGDASNTGDMEQMISYLHLSVGDTLFFQDWVPQTAGSVVGACIGLFLLGIVERLLGAARSSAELFWASSSTTALAPKGSADASCTDCEDETTKDALSGLLAAAKATVVAPFVPSHDVVRGTFHAVQAALGFAFMLVAMTFNIGYIIAILLGLGVGETLFGRFISTSFENH